MKVTAWKVYFPVFGLNTGKYGPEIIPYLDTFHAMSVYMKGQERTLLYPENASVHTKTCRIQNKGS